MPFCRTGFHINLFLLLEAYCCRLWEFFVLSSLEKNHQMLRSGPWSSTYDLGWIKNEKSSPCFRKMFWKSSLYISTSCLFFNASNTYAYRVWSNSFWPCWKPLVWETQGRLLSEVFERKADYFILTTSSKKTIGLMDQERKKIHEMLWKSHFRVETTTFLCFFLCCLPWSWTKDNIRGLSFGSSQQKYQLKQPNNQ